MASALLVGARRQQGRRGVVDSDERQHQPRRVVRGQLLVQHDLLGDRHAAAPLARPVRHGVTRRCAARRTTPSGSATNSSSPTPVCACAPVARDVLGAPRAHCGPEARRVVARSCEQSRQTRCRRPCGSVRRAWRTGPAAAGAAAGCSATATTGWSRRRTRPRRAAGGRPGTRSPPPRSPTSSAPARRSSASGLPGADAPQRVLGEDLHPAALDLGVGQLELHALERRQRLSELLAQARRARW